MSHLKPGAKRTTVIISILWVGVCLAAETRVIDTQEEWQKVVADSRAMELADGLLLPQAGEAFVAVTLPTNGKKQALKSVTLRQFPVWDSWKGIPKVVPGGIEDAPVLLAVEPGNYWIVHPKVMHSTDMVHWKESVKEMEKELLKIVKWKSFLLKEDLQNQKIHGKQPYLEQPNAKKKEVRENVSE